jgi:hypothetical protein
MKTTRAVPFALVAMSLSLALAGGARAAGGSGGQVSETPNSPPVGAYVTDSNGVSIPADLGPSASTIAALIQAGSGHLDAQQSSTTDDGLLARGAGPSGDPSVGVLEAERIERDREGPDGTIARLVEAGSGRYDAMAQQFVDTPNRFATRGNAPAADRSASGMSNAGN